MKRTPYTTQKPSPMRGEAKTQGNIPLGCSADEPEALSSLWLGRAGIQPQHVVRKARLEVARYTTRLERERPTLRSPLVGYVPYEHKESQADTESPCSGRYVPHAETPARASTKGLARRPQLVFEHASAAMGRNGDALFRRL